MWSCYGRRDRINTTAPVTQLSINSGLHVGRDSDAGANNLLVDGTIEGSVLFLTEQAAAEANVAGKGQFWVKTATPNEPYFDDDTGVEIPLDNRYIDRGDPASSDFEHTDLTRDAAWHAMDLSSIVSSNAIAISLSLKVSNSAANTYMGFRKNGNTNALTSILTRVQVAGIANDATVVVACDSNQVIEYIASATGWATIRVTVLGWWLA